MPTNGINTRICSWLYFMIMSIDFTRTQSPIGGGGFLPDPFLELNSAVTSPAIQKSNKSEPSCLTNGALAGSIIGTLIMSAFIGFLTWLIYLRPKFQELHYKHLHENRRIRNVQQHHTAVPYSSFSNHKQQIDNDRNTPQLPLDVTDYKFGTFPFRQSQTSSINGHYNRTDWLNRISSSFRSVNMEQDSEMIDVELLEPAFTGLNFSITGNMRAGIFVKDILDKGQIKSNSSNQLKAGDRIMALTVCFESIVYEDALTILSYASPYPVIIRVKRPENHTKVNETIEKRTITTNKVKWRDDFEHYDNDTPVTRSFVQPNPPPPPSITNPLPSNSRTPSSPQNRPSPKKPHQHSSTQPRHNAKSSSTNKVNRLKTSSNSVLATSGATTKRPYNDIKKPRTKTTNNQRAILSSTGLTSKPSMSIPTSPMSTNKKPVKSVTDAVISYLHYKGGAGVEHATDVVNPSESAIMPYYDSPYDYYYGGGGQVSQYQYLHQSQLNKNNNNSLSTESLTAVTPNLARSVYTLQLSSHPIQRRYKRCLSSPAIITPSATMIERTILNEIENIDTFV